MTPKRHNCNDTEKIRRAYFVRILIEGNLMIYYNHFNDAIMGAITSQITILYSIVNPDADQRKHQSSASLAFVRGIHRTGEFPAQMASYAENVSF